MSAKLDRMAIMIADRVAPLVADRILHRVMVLLDIHGELLIDAAEVARRFGVSRAYVYRHADELGAVRLGDGARPRLRFDAVRVAGVLAAHRGRNGLGTSERD